jgi:peptide/nickel transport system substrate-binding protein
VRRGLSLSIILLVGLVSACTDQPTPNASGRPDNTAMVIAEAAEPNALNPLAGYAPDGAAKIFDGLLEHQADSSLAPVLAASLPTVSPDGRSWTITLRAGVTFSDGTPFDARAVVATYRALLDPTVGSPLRPRFSMLTGVAEIDPETVRFDLGYPYPAFPQLLTLGILPAALATPTPVAAMAVDTKPVGTGPYLLRSWTKGHVLVLAANPRYPIALGGPPKVKTVTVEFIADDAQRVKMLQDGKLDGAPVAPTQAAQNAKSDTFSVLTDPAADLRAVQLPASGPVTGDPTIRLALNDAVNRAAMVSGPLAGDGAAADTPMPGVLPEFTQTTATFAHDPAHAADLLTSAGWQPGPDGIRSRNGVSALFTVDYPVGETLDAGLANAFAADAKAVGISVRTAAITGPPPVADATLISIGNPFDPDLAAYPLLGSALAGADQGVVTALENGRRQTDPAQRAVAYRQFQRAYLLNPTMVSLVLADHTYLMRNNWNGYQQVTDDSFQDVTWGPWWNLETWTPR